MHDFSKDACLLTDFYQFTMAQAYFDQKRHQTEAIFHLFFRKNPLNANWVIAAGINDALDYIETLRFSKEALTYLASITSHNKPVFSKDFLDFLATSEAHVDVTGVRDGQIVFPNEPVLRIRGPLFLCQLLETPLLTTINFQSLIATKARRIKIAARGKPIIDFGLRRAQGFDGAITATKAAIIGGVDKTSNVWAAREFGLAPSGTLAHSFIMSYDNQEHAFLDFCSSFKDNAVLLVDTYDPLVGIDDAVKVFRLLMASGHRPLGIRIDSGDMGHLSTIARHRLDNAGLRDCKIIVSGDLDEYAIEKLEQAQAPIDIYGVGTRLVTAYDDPALAGVYKLASIGDGTGFRDTCKTSTNKQSWPGHQSISRFFVDEMMAHDVIYDERFGISPSSLPKSDTHKHLHELLMRQGKKRYFATLMDMRTYAETNVAKIAPEFRSITKAVNPYPVYFDIKLAHKDDERICGTRENP